MNAKQRRFGNIYGSCIRKKPYTYLEARLQIDKKLKEEQIKLLYYKCKFCQAIHLTRIAVSAHSEIYYWPQLEDKLCYYLYRMGFK